MSLALMTTAPMRAPLLAALASLVLASAAPAVRAQAGEGLSEVALVQGLVEKSLAPLAPGYLEWMRQRLRSAGLTVAARSASLLPSEELEKRPDLGTTARRVQQAARAGAASALLVDLRRGSLGLEIGLRLFDTGAGTLRAGRLTNATSVTLAEDGNRALQALLPMLGHRGRALEVPPPATMGEIAELARALRAFDRGELANAWNEIAKSSVIGADELRNEIANAAADPATPLSERARLLAAQGDAAAAWSLIAQAVTSELSNSTSPSSLPKDAKLLQAAGEIQIARGRLPEANQYLRHSLAVDARNPEATLSLAEVLTGQNQLDEARDMLERAAALDPDSPDAVSMLARVELDPARKATLLMSAGRREARRLNPGRAHLYFSRAAKADPSISAETKDRAGELYEQIGETRAARDSYEAAIQQGGPTGPRLHRLGRVQQAVGDVEGAETSYLDSLKLAAKQTGVLTDLGVLYSQFGRASDAVTTLERASKLSPQDPTVQRPLARALTLRGKSGDRERASQLFQSASQHEPPAAQDLMDLAALQRESGDLTGARESFENALALQPFSTAAQRQLAAVLRESGDVEGARTAEALSEALADGSPSTLPAAGDEISLSTRSQRFDALLQTFASAEARSAPETVVLLGLHAMPPETWEDRARGWIRPRKLDIGKLGQELADAIAKDHQLVSGTPPDAHMLTVISQLFRFQSGDSLDPDIIASLNEQLGVDGVFLALAFPRSGQAADAAGCESRDSLEIQLRKLGGVKSYEVSALSNTACLPASLAAVGSWRWQAGALAAFLLLFIAAPLVRGWGGVVVDFKLPPHTKALFAVSLKRRPRKVKDQSARSTGPASWSFQKRLQSLSRFERRLEGKRIIFRWIPARRRAYYLTVRGPLLDYTTEQIIGDFLEEKTVRVRRGKAIKIDFDMCPSEAAIEVRVTQGGTLIQQSRVSVRGVAGSLRYASEGSAFIYAGAGEHVLVASDGASLAEQTVRIETLDPVRVAIDLESRGGLVFKDCPAAVDPYMAGDFRSAADALDSGGNDEAAHAVRALWHRAQGDRAAEAQELAASGRIVESAEILAAGSDPNAAAELFEQAGEHKRAAEAYQQSGDLVAAARNYESAYDYENAVDCYRDLGETDKVIQLLEATGEYFEAARAAAGANQLDRAISNYQQVDSRHPCYSEACRDMGGLLAARGHVDLAIEKFNEALELGGDEALPLETLVAFGRLLEENGRAEAALDIYERVRRRDLNYQDINTRIEGLKDDATRLATAATSGAGERPTAAAPPEETRYEMIDELGRGGMGVVYKARDKHLGRLVAMKFLPDNLQQHPTAVKLFLREARATAALNHPNIVTMYDAAQQDGRYFISMECLEGVGLDAVLKKRGPLPAKLLAQLGMQVCAGLEYAHRKRIVHRDIKPSNLFVTKDRVLKVMDFGLAKAIEEVRRNSTMIGGTPNFMAPEQAAGEPVDERTDLYSLGATLFQLLTGTVPFEDGDAAYHHRHTAPPDARERLASVPSEFAKLLLQMMAKAPGDRIQSAGEVGARLKQIFESS